MANQDVLKLLERLSEGVAISQGVPESMLGRNIATKQKEAALREKESAAMQAQRISLYILNIYIIVIIF